MTYKGGYCYFSECAPKDGKGSLENWAWDWLNLMFYEFYFEREDAEQQAINVSMWLFSDTGYFISDHPAAQETDVTTFAPVEKAGTKIGFLLYQDWKEAYSQIRTNHEYLRRFIENGEIPEFLENEGIRGKSFDFARLSDDISTEAVIDELVILAKSGGLPLSRVKRPL